MSTNRMDSSQGKGWDDERILEWILNQDPGAQSAAEGAAQDKDEAGPNDPAARARMGELTEFLTDCRTALVDDEMLDAGQVESPERVAAWTEQVLARTTREDLSWRGDLSLVGGYVRERLSRSVLLRFAAASLLLHMAALPVLAYYVFLAPAPEAIEIDTIRYVDQYPAQPFPEDRAEPEFRLDEDVDEEPAVREQADGAEGERW